MNDRIWRQGDLLFVEADKIPSGFVPARSNVLLRGEATGHSHRLENGTAFEQQNSYGYTKNPLITKRELYISIGKGGRIVHEEHATLFLPSGIYHIIYQREYTQTEHTPAGWAWVGD